MFEEKHHQSWDEGYKQNSIHQNVKVGEIFHKFGVPNSLLMPFHEMVFARSKYPQYMSDLQAFKFLVEFADIERLNQLNSQDGDAAWQILDYIELCWKNSNAT